MIMSDNGIQFSLDEVKSFCTAWLFEYVTSFPRYPLQMEKQRSCNDCKAVI